MSKQKRKARTYTPEYKEQAVLLVKEIGLKPAAEELGIPHGTLGGWIHAAKRGKIDTGLGTQSPQSALTQAARIKELEAENKLIQKENKRLRELNDFLEEASAFFAARRQK